MPYKIPAPKKCYESFGLSLIFQLVLPILPLGLEYWLTTSVSSESLMLVASLYAITVGVSSSSGLFFGLGIVFGVVFAVAFGAITGGKTLMNSEVLASYSIVAIFVIHACERWNLHVVEEKPYWRF